MYTVIEKVTNVSQEQEERERRKKPASLFLNRHRTYLMNEFQEACGGEKAGMLSLL